MTFRANRFAMSFAILVALGASFSGSMIGMSTGGEGAAAHRLDPLSFTAMPLIEESRADAKRTVDVAMYVPSKRTLHPTSFGNTGRFIFDGPAKPLSAFQVATILPPPSFGRLPRDTAIASK